MNNNVHFFRQSSGGGGDAFIATFRTTTANESITLPYLSTGTYSGTIDWGDGTVVANTYANRAHTYVNSGDYNITILGDCAGWQFNSSGDRLKIYDIVNWGIGFIMKSAVAFSGCKNLDVTATDVLDLSLATSLTRAFFSCNNLIGNASFNDWDTSNVTNMTQFFHNCNSFNQPLNNWDTSNVTNMYRMFKSCFNFNQPLNNWNTSNVTNMREMFSANTNAFNQDISNWDFSGLNNANSLRTFFQTQTSATYDATYYDNLLIKWASSPSVGGLQPNIIGFIDMGSIKYTANGAAARASILANNKAVTINDGGQI